MLKIRQASRNAGDEDWKAVVRCAAHGAHNGERAHQAVLGSEDRFTHVAEKTRLATFVVEAGACARAVGDRCARSSAVGPVGHPAPSLGEPILGGYPSPVEAHQGRRV